VDLFDLLDGLFKGVVYFFYNLVESIAVLIRRPLRGPLALARKARRQGGARQLSGTTFLFVLFFGFYAALLTLVSRSMSDNPEEPGLGDSLAEAVIAPPSFDAGWLWMVLAASLASTVAVDMVLRAGLSLALPRRRTRRALALDGLQFAFLWPLFLVAAFAFLGDGSGLVYAAVLGATPKWTILLLAALAVALLPAAVIGVSGLRPRLRRAAAGRASTMIGSLLLAILFLASAFAGTSLANYIENRQHDDIEMEPENNLLTPYLSCDLALPQPRVEAVIWNRGPEPVVLRSGDFRLYVGGTAGADLSKGESWDNAVDYSLSYDPEAPQMTVIGAGGTGLVRLFPADFAWSADLAGKPCALQVQAPGIQASGYGNHAFHGEVDEIDPPVAEAEGEDGPSTIER
jgi:hypothetical protein